MGQLSQTLVRWGRALFAPAERMRLRYQAFKSLLAADEASLLLVAELEEIFAGARQVDPARTRWLCGQLTEAVGEVVERLLAMNPTGYAGLREAFARVRGKVQASVQASLPLCHPYPATDSGGLSAVLAAGHFPGLAPSAFVLPLAQALGRPDLAGGKAANLAAAQRAGLRVPPGHVVSTDAFRAFLGTGKLRPRLERLLRQVDLSRPERLGPLCLGMRTLVLGAEVPEELAQALREAAASPEFGGDLLAVRSSAVGEDGELSFAGQYASELNVPPQDIVDAYRRVVAAKYRTRAVTYRVRCGLPDDCSAMAMLLLPMVDAASAGVLHSSDNLPAQGGKCLSVFALPGLGDALVSGSAEPWAARLARRLPTQVLDVSGGAGVEFGQSALPELVLPELVLSELVLTGLVLESVFGRPQEVEWALDKAGRLFVLQSRTFNEAPEPLPGEEVVLPDGAQEPCVPEGPCAADVQVLAEGLSLVAPGQGCGPVHHLTGEAEIPRIPAGCVLAVDTLTPALARCVDRVAAVAARVGSRASHFASVAREAGLPVLSGLEDLRARLPEGLLVTVDATRNATMNATGGRILLGCAQSLLAGPRRRQDEERQRLAQRFADLARQTCHLALTDPEAPDFAPAGCASLHDLVRFCHEKAVAEMVGLGEAEDSGRTGRGLGKARRLRSELPLSLYLLDLGGGLEPAAGNDDIAPEGVASLPMQALWQGLARSGEPWQDTGFSCDWQEFDRISAGIFRKNSRLLASYALLSADYLHLLVRFGYHFAVLDSLCGPRAEANYVAFRFKGGGGLPEQRRLRIGFISQVLSASGFVVRVRGDMLDARLARAEAGAVRRALILLGRLLVRTQRMDLGLADEAQAARLAEEFLAADGAVP
ncbi:MAG: PEP/pyruvate-binding domain-containing protein [Humidesulfovibrio sp.]|nr:PEP/pyruvate-binding domain-containing protein [Humidesulfovibrio sp.]